MTHTEQTTEQTTEQPCSVSITGELWSQFITLVGENNLENFSKIIVLYKSLGRDTINDSESPVSMERLLQDSVAVALLVADKNVAYGDSFRNCETFLRLLFPTGIPPEKYGNALFVLRVFDKLSRIATSEKWGGEDPARDIAGYSLLRMAYKSSERPQMDEKSLDALLEDTVGRIVVSLQAVVAHSSHELPKDFRIETSFSTRIKDGEEVKFDFAVKFTTVNGEVKYER